MGNRLISMRFIKGLGFLYLAGMAGLTSAQSHLELNDGSPQTDNEINEAQWNSRFAALNTQFDNQIAAQRAAIDRANALKDQCKNDKDISDINAKQQKNQQTVQALSGLAQPAMQTVGSLYERSQLDVAKNKAEVLAEQAAVIEEIKSAKGNNGRKQFKFQNNRVSFDSDSCPSVEPTPKGTVTTDAMFAAQNANLARTNCITQGNQQARDYNDDLRAINDKLAKLAQANSQLIAHGAQLAASGVGGLLVAGMSGSQNKAQGKVAGIGMQSCLQQAAFTIADGERKLQQLEKQRAQQMLDLNIAKAADDLARKGLKDVKGPVAVVQKGALAKADKFKLPAKGDGGGAPAAGGGGSSGGGGGGSGGAAPWGFNKDGGGEEPGGSSLPQSEDGVSFNGTADSGGGESGGFGTFAEKPAEAGPEPAAADGEAEVAGEMPEGAGDGGLDSLMIRMRNIHAKYASTLLQSQDLSQVATGIKNTGDL
jgi:hypothetical protein